MQHADAYITESFGSRKDRNRNQNTLLGIEAGEQRLPLKGAVMLNGGENVFRDRLPEVAAHGKLITAADHDTISVGNENMVSGCFGNGRKIHPEHPAVERIVLSNRGRQMRHLVCTAAHAGDIILHDVISPEQKNRDSHEQETEADHRCRGDKIP